MSDNALKRSKPRALFDQPRFNLLRDSHIRNYATVDNLLEVVRPRRTHYVPIEVHTHLFLIMEYLKVPPGRAVRLYLEEVDSFMLFGFMVEEQDLYDLWVYTKNQVPPDILVNRGD